MFKSRTLVLKIALDWDVFREFWFTAS